MLSRCCLTSNSHHPWPLAIDVWDGWELLPNNIQRVSHWLSLDLVTTIVGILMGANWELSCVWHFGTGTRNVAVQLQNSKWLQKKTLGAQLNHFLLVWLCSPPPKVPCHFVNREPLQRGAAEEDGPVSYWNPGGQTGPVFREQWRSHKTAFPRKSERENIGQGKMSTIYFGKLLVCLSAIRYIKIK